MILPTVARIPVLVLVAVACTSAPTASIGQSVAPPAATPPPRAIATPTTTQGPVATPSPRATEIAPPTGALGYSDSADVGWLGSYCWQGTCANVAKLPDAKSLPEITVPEGAMTFSIEGAVFANWVAMYGTDGDSLQHLDKGGSPFDLDAATPAPDELLTFAELDSPPTGDWVVTVQVFMPGGDASYAWHVLVE